MVRVLTAATAAEAAKATGAFPRRILEVQFPAPTGTKYFSGEALTTPVVAEGRIKGLGEISIMGEPGKGGSLSSMTIELADEDQFFKNLQETKPGIQDVDSFLWLWFEGTSWDTDKVLDFGGVLTAPMNWNENRASFSFTMKGFEHKFDRELGRLATQAIFPEIDCSQNENDLIPICYGCPVFRVPAILIDRPGQASLNVKFLATDVSLTINSTALAAGFTTGTSINLAIGVGNRWERVTGSFASGSSTVFNITSRGSIDASGTIPGFFGSGGFQFILIPRADVTNPDNSRAGNALHVQNGGVWKTLVCSHWTQQGANQAVAIKGDLTLVTGDNYKLGSIPGHIADWSPGTSVAEFGTFTYVCNYLPTQSINRVEARTQVDVGGGSQSVVWLEINNAHYTVDNDNRTWNIALGRTANDPGVATVTLNFTPKQLGIADETVFVTMDATVDVGAGPSPAGSFGQEAVCNPADVIEHILTNGFLGNVPTARVNAASFATAATKISTKFSFAILDSKAKLNEIISDLAYQAHSILFWDEGKATMKALERPLTGSTSTFTRSDYTMIEKLSIEDMDIKNYTTELIAKFRPSVTSDELVLVRESTDGITDFGIKRDEIALWAYQFPTSVALATEFWLEYFLETNRRVTFTTWLNALKIQPGDIITLDIDDGAGNVIFNSVLAQVISVRKQPGNLREGRMERITLTCDLKLYDYTVSVTAPTDITCIGNAAKREFERSGKLYLQSSGVGRSLFVGPGLRFPNDGNSNIQQPVTSDPTPGGTYETVNNLLIYITPPNPGCP